MKGKKFLRSDSFRHLRFNRRKKLKWRKPRGRHNKIRKKRFGYPNQPSIGYKKPKEKSGLVKERKVFFLNNLNEFDKLKKNSFVIISKKIGARKRMELLKKADEKGINILNININKK